MGDDPSLLIHEIVPHVNLSCDRLVYCIWRRLKAGTFRIALKRLGTMQLLYFTWKCFLLYCPHVRPPVTHLLTD